MSHWSGYLGDTKTDLSFSGVISRVEQAPRHREKDPWWARLFITIGCVLLWCALIATGVLVAYTSLVSSMDSPAP